MYMGMQPGKATRLKVVIDTERAMTEQMLKAYGLVGDFKPGRIVEVFEDGEPRRFLGTFTYGPMGLAPIKAGLFH